MSSSQKPVIAIGNFDGVHRGHRDLLARAQAAASVASTPFEVLTFNPHTRSYFQPNLPPFRLTPDSAKVTLLTALCGVAHVHLRRFNQHLAETEAEDFVSRILVKELQASHVFVGEGFNFGRRKAGTTDKMRDWLKAEGVAFTAVPVMKDESGERISATRIRALLKEGKAGDAAKLIGRRWGIVGAVEHGDEQGRKLGFPTANIALGDFLRPKFGVYAAWASVSADRNRKYAAVVNIGTRPTMAGEAERCEAHLFDFNRTIYGEEWGVELVEFIRPEQKYTSLDLLKQQIAQDCDAARAALRANT